jgi:hypothetical protein
MYKTSEKKFAVKDYNKVIVVNSRNVQEPIDICDIELENGNGKKVKLGELLLEMENEIGQLYCEINRVENESKGRYEKIISALEQINEKMKVKGTI